MPNPTPTTDERLRSFLDTNQMAREHLAADLLALDRRFSGVKPRHPRGGPDQGVDIEASFEGQTVAVAVGFVNSASDTDAEKRQIKSKYKADAESAAKRAPRPGMFVFFTNVNLTLGEKSELHQKSKAAGISGSEIFDRDRIRVLLDSLDGLGIRYRYLQIPLADAEQAAFFSRWGDDIQRVIGNRFSRVELSLARLQFLYESAFPLHAFVVTAELDREYSAAEVGHFRLICSLHLEEPKNNFFQIYFGSADNASRKDAKKPADINPSASGIGRSMCGGVWIQELQSTLGVRKVRSKTRTRRWLEKSHETLSSFTSVGLERIRLLSIDFGFGNELFRLPPYLELRDMDGCSFVLFTNHSFAEKIKVIHVSGNEYKLAEFTGKHIHVGKPNADPYFPYPLSKQELGDPWVRIMDGMSAFKLSFSDSTPLRMYEAELIEDSLFEMRRKRVEENKKRIEELP